MANHPSAIKRHKQSEKRRLRNRSEKASLSTQLKKARTEIENKGASPQAGEVRNAVSALGRAASKGVLTKKTAARRISRLMKRAAKTA